MAFIWNVLFFLIAIVILVAVHEWGHFIVARWCGVRVLRFSIGFGPILWRKKDKRGTEFVLSAIPLGGYVKMLQKSDVTEHDQDLKSETFEAAKTRSKLAIVLAGPMANFILAWLVFLIFYLQGVTSLKPIIEAPIDNTPLSKAISDSNLDQFPYELKAVDENPVGNWRQVVWSLVQRVGDDQPISLHLTPFESSTINRGQSHELLLENPSWGEAVDPLAVIGIKPYLPQPTTCLAMVEPESPADKAGLMKGDCLTEIRTIDGTSQVINEFADLTRFLSQISSASVVVSVMPKEGVARETRVELAEKSGRYILGIRPELEPAIDSLRYDQSFTLKEASIAAFQKVIDLIELSFSVIKKLLFSEISVNHLSGPIGIATGAGQAATVGFQAFLSFLGLLSVNLGFINLLPIPVLDGGQAVLYSVEGILKRPIKKRTLIAYQQVGFVIVLMIMLVAIFNDISRVIQS